MSRRWWLALLLTAAAGPARAQFVPVVPEEIQQVVQRRARLYLARPCEVRGEDGRRRLLPGEAVVALAAEVLSGGQINPTRIRVKAGAEEVVIALEHLSRRPLPYCYRCRQSFDDFATGLARDAVSLMDRYHQISQKWRYEVPSFDRERQAVVSDYYRLQALRGQLSFLRMRLFHLGYGTRDERRELEREPDWLPSRGEAFIQQHAGHQAPELRKRLQAIYAVMNSLDNVPSFCSRLGRLQRELQASGTVKKEVSSLGAGHEARLQAEEAARTHTKLTDLQARLVLTLTHARTRLLALGVKVR